MTAVLQEKTKAKKRYLKAKKERRKKRKVLSTVSGGHDHQAPPRESPDSDPEEVGSHRARSEPFDHDDSEQEPPQVEKNDRNGAMDIVGVVSPANHIRIVYLRA